ncbi:MAG: Asp-tRNA(Asn)/Glu-tRNA(Gln) amidotransferase subunit GatC [Clostridia bacterium]|nr:Asp-tRNA(Asn)/Glu-tRNA(Gln) amidotransferase subunit GatC [Clostridia bacterium]MBR3152182.1 Asp-tRNA(Asn)/Glu-tRNA(Gln) amidotransferase subunit GatC [Clostridia bacterium]MBR3152281.1 Asp-tRNA(Asn)/Glu-tRNA(Gln) amidotransferase subunit GatC [Clostridia bacterium]
MENEKVQISDEEILHIAKLARIKLGDNEIQDYKKNLEEILDFANIVNSVDTENIGETIGVNENYNRFRADVVTNKEMRDKLLQNAPSQDEGMFRIPKVIS